VCGVGRPAHSALASGDRRARRRSPDLAESRNLRPKVSKPRDNCLVILETFGRSSTGSGDPRTARGQAAFAALGAGLPTSPKPPTEGLKASRYSLGNSGDLRSGVCEVGRPAHSARLIFSHLPGIGTVGYVDAPAIERNRTWKTKTGSDPNGINIFVSHCPTCVKHCCDCNACTGLRCSKLGVSNIVCGCDCGAIATLKCYRSACYD